MSRRTSAADASAAASRRRGLVCGRDLVLVHRERRRRGVGVGERAAVAIHASNAGRNSGAEALHEEVGDLVIALAAASAQAMNVATSTCVCASARPCARAASIRMALVRPAAAACSPFQRVAW